MRIERIKRWQWMLISLVVGALIAGARSMSGADVDVHNSVTQTAFENGLIMQTKGVAHFKDLVVSPNRAKQDKSRTYYIVMGKYFSGRPELKGGKAMAVWKPCFFAEQSAVYAPHVNLALLNKAGGPDYVKKYKSLKKPTVLDFLAMMKEAKGVNYNYAWWAEPGKGTVLWMGLSFVVVGLIWPSVVSLLAFGTLLPPPEEKGVDLSKVRSSTSTASAGVKPTGPTAEDMDELKRMEEALKAKIAAADREAGPSAPVAAAAGPAPIKQLTATKLEMAAVQDQHEQKAFGAGQDDFYPTERKVVKPKPEEKR